MLEYLILLACVLVLAYFIYKFFEKKKEEGIGTIAFGKTTKFPEASAPYRKVFSKPMKPFYYPEKKEESKLPPKLEIIASCKVCRAGLNSLSKRVCLKCMRVFCDKHLAKHKCKKKHFPKYEMARKKYDDGAVVYYTDRKVPAKNE